MMQKVLLFCFISFISFTASADLFLFEPGIGYNRGHYQTNKTQGIGVNLKAGFNIGQTFFIAADVAYSDLQAGTIPSMKETDTGVVFGGNMRNWRIWYSMITGATLSYPSGTDTVTTKGAGSKLGLSALISGKTNLNFEFRFLDLTETATSTGTTNVTEFLDSALVSFSWSL